MKFIRILALIISALLIVINIFNYFSKKDWIETTATITFVGLPDGMVFGNYTDLYGNTHDNTALYIDYFHQGHGADVDALSGKEVDIIYNPATNEIKKKNNLFMYFSLIFIIATLILHFSFKKRSRE